MEGLSFLGFCQLEDRIDDEKEFPSLENLLVKLFFLELQKLGVYLARVFFLPSHVDTFSDSQENDIEVDQH